MPSLPALSDKNYDENKKYKLMSNYNV